jgi:hypothetical protein
MTNRLLGIVLVAASAVGLAATSCSDDASTGDGDADCSTVKGYAELSSAISRCTGCHSSTLVGATARYAAPDGTDYDTYEGAKQQAEAPKGKDLVSRIQDGTMPLSPMPGGTFQGTEKQDLITWAQCGTPQ